MNELTNLRKVPVLLLAGVAAGAIGIMIASQDSRRGPSPSRPSTTTTAGIRPATSQLRNCIVRPSACGYPDQTNTGVPAGMQLTRRSGVISVTTPGQTISGIAVSGAIEVHASHTTIRNDEIIVNATQAGCSSPCGGRGIYIAPGVTDTLIQNVTCHGGAPDGGNVTEFCIDSNDPSNVIDRVHAYYCTTCFVGPGIWENSFVNLNGTIPREHYEDIYYGGGSRSITIRHDTLLNPPHNQGDTAAIFLSVDFGDERNVSVTDNLLAGGALVLYGGASGSKGSVVGPMTYAGNRFSKIFYRDGGSHGIGAYFNQAVTAWSHNYWDDTLRPVVTP